MITNPFARCDEMRPCDAACQVENLRRSIFDAIGAEHVDVFAAVRPHDQCVGDDCGACKVTLLVMKMMCVMGRTRWFHVK